MSVETLPPRALQLLSVLEDLPEHTDAAGFIHVGRSLLANRLGLTTRQITNLVRILKEAGLLLVAAPRKVLTPKGWRTRGVNAYRLITKPLRPGARRKPRQRPRRRYRPTAHARRRREETNFPPPPRGGRRVGATGAPTPPPATTPRRPAPPAPRRNVTDGATWADRIRRAALAAATAA